jgi:hypothetical protein
VGEEEREVYSLVVSESKQTMMLPHVRARHPVINQPSSDLSVSLLVATQPPIQCWPHLHGPFGLSSWRMVDTYPIDMEST